MVGGLDYAALVVVVDRRSVAYVLCMLR